MRGLLPMLLFAARGLGRRPGEALLAGLALAGLAAVVATPLLAGAALEEGGRVAFDAGPGLVVRRVGPWGFAPLPTAEGLEALRAVPGVTAARARRLGVVATAEGPATLVGVDAAAAGRLARLGLARPGPAEVVVGPAFAGLEPGATLRVRGPSGRSETLRVGGSLDGSLGLVGHDLLLVGWPEAGRLLGLPEGAATELVVDVFHDAEEEAIRADVEAALPWPARLTGRTEARQAALAAIARRSGLAEAGAAPALLALLLLVLAAGRVGAGGRSEVGLLRALGWTTKDLVRLGLLRALATGLPAVLLGLAAAFALVLWPGWGWRWDLLGLGWAGRPPPVVAIGKEAGLELLAAVAGLVLAPWLAAALWPTLRAATADPADLLDDGGAP